MLKKLLKYFLILAALCAGIYCYLILFPQVLFKNKVDYRNFSIYSNNAIDKNINWILDNCIVQLKTSEIYDSTVHQKIFFIDDSFYYQMTKSFSKERCGYHEFLVNNSMVVPKVDVRNNTITFLDGKARNLAQTMIHETIHSMQEKKLGFWKVIEQPEWKIEGYAFYIAKNNLIINNGHISYKYVRHNLEDLSNHSMRKHYWMYGVLTGYLLNEKHLTFEQFMADDVQETATVNEVVNWYFNSSRQELISML